MHSNKQHPAKAGSDSKQAQAYRARRRRLLKLRRASKRRNRGR